jgi:Fic family protein
MRDFLTFKSGKFYFSEQYDHTRISGLLIHATILNETIADLPILPALASSLEPDIMYSSISGTAAIEGNPISREDVKKIAEGQDIKEYSKKDKQEILNLLEAYNMLTGFNVSSTPQTLSEAIICDFHKIITHKVPHEHNIPGQYRNGTVHVGDKAHGGIYSPPKISADIKNLMEVFIEWINSAEILALNPFIRAALAHYHLCIIHPFWDGNGRTARLIEALVLQTANIKYMPRELSNYYYKNVDDYYTAFSKSINEKNITPFIEFYLKAVIESLTKIKELIFYFIRIFSLKDYYKQKNRQRKITKRQLDLLNLLTDFSTNTFFTLKDLSMTPPFSLLYRDVSTQTARRDLAKLSSLNLLTMADKGQYRLNLRVLG